LKALKTGDILDIRIEDLGAGGEGIAHIGQGEARTTIFVPFALKGEFVKIKIDYVKRCGISYASLLKIYEPSPDRIKPQCENFTKCGGCDFLHLNYGKQLYYKRKNLLAVLKKNAGFLGNAGEVVKSKNEFYYRNKISVPFGEIGGKAVVGFYKEKSHEIIPLKTCPLHAEWADKLILAVLNYANEQKLSVYNPQTNKGLLRHITARFLGGHLSVCLVINGNSLHFHDKLIALLSNEFTNFSLYTSTNTKQNNVIMGESVQALCKGKEEITVSGISVSINPLSFFQVNDYIRERIYERIVSSVRNEGSFIDAYSGVGLLGAIIAKEKAEISIINVEIVAKATEDANFLCERNNLKERIQNINQDASAFFENLSYEKVTKPITIFLDPPRKGADIAVINAIKAFKNKANALNKGGGKLNLIYLSCNPATLSRDLNLLKPEFEIEAIIPYDMFPQTSHLETLAFLK